MWTNLFLFDLVIFLDYIVSVGFVVVLIVIMIIIIMIIE